MTSVELDGVAADFARQLERELTEAKALADGHLLCLNACKSQRTALSHRETALHCALKEVKRELRADDLVTHRIIDCALAVAAIKATP